MNTFAVYKPKGMTSHDVVDKIRQITNIKKVGHAGTLDPLAQGVLVIGVGREATKRLNEVVKKEKEYLATIQLGATSTTDDKEGKIIKTQKIKKTKKQINKVLKKFVGHIEQIPPAFSAIKIKGRPAYKIARKGSTPKLKPRKVEIKKIELIEYKYPAIKLRVTTGPGVYIRSLARDIGQQLKTGGYLTDLERTRVGKFTKTNALTLSQLNDTIK